MMLVMAVTAWGTLATAAWAHSLSLDRFGDLLEMHFAHAGRGLVMARVVVVVEAAIALAAIGGYFAPIRFLVIAAAVAGFGLGLAYVIWVARLVLADSGLPCACSFSSAPPTWWSVGRAAVICGFGAFSTAPPVAEVGTGPAVGLFVAGSALGAAIYTLPDAMAWPRPARALRRQVAAGAGLPVRSRRR